MILEPLLGILQNPHIVEGNSEDEDAIKVVRGSHSAIKHLMEKKDSKAKRELKNVERRLVSWLGKVRGDVIRPQLEDYHEGVKNALNTIA